MAAFPNFDVEAAARRINDENGKEDRLRAERRIDAQIEARRIAAEFRAHNESISRIWCFGSTFDVSRPYRMDSDIDLAVEGGDILKLISIAEASSFSVDLIDITDCDDEFARLLRESATLV
jgi:predicted nucleotidyltransferase